MSNTHIHSLTLILATLSFPVTVMANESASFRLSPDGTQFGSKTHMESPSFQMEGGITWTNAQTLVSTSFQLQAAPGSSSASSTSSFVPSSVAPSTTDSGGRRGQGTTTTDLLDSQVLQIRQIAPAGSSSSSSRRSAAASNSSRASIASSRSSGRSSQSSVRPRTDNVDPLPTMVQSSATSTTTNLALLGQLLRLDVSDRFEAIDPETESVANPSSAATVSSQIASSLMAQSSRSPDVAVLGSDVAVDRFDRTSVSDQHSGVVPSQPLDDCQTFTCKLRSGWGSQARSDDTPITDHASLPWWVTLLIACQAALTVMITLRIHRRVPYEAWHALWRRR